MATYAELKKRVKSGQTSTQTTKSGTSSYAELKEKAKQERFEEDVKKVDSSYINLFIDTANRYLSSAEEDYGKVNWGNASKAYQSRQATTADLDRRRDVIRSWLDSHKSSLDGDTYTNISSILDQYSSGATSIMGAFREARDVYGQYSSQEEYDDAVEYHFRSSSDNSKGRQQRYEDNQKRIEELKAEWEAYEYDWSDSKQREAANKKRKEIQAQIEELEADNRKYERGEDGYISKTVDDNYKVTGNADFVEDSAKRDLGNPTREALWDYDVSVQEGSLALSNGGYYDEDGNIRDAKGNIVMAAQAPEIEDKLGLFLASGEEGVTEAYNLLSASNGNYTNTWANLMQEGDVNGWKYLTDQEIGIYYYLYENNGQEAAYKFLSDMTTELTRRETQATQDYIEQAPLLEQIFLNVASIPMSVIGGGLAFVDDAVNTIQGEEINPYSRMHAFQNTASAIREDTAADINNLTGNIALPYVGTTFGDVYQSVMSMGDMAFGSLLGGGGKVYGTLMGMGAASSTAKDLYQSGASAGQIAAGGLLAGAAEMFFEKYSIEHFINLKNPKSAWDVVKNFLVQGGIEASEEMGTEIANTITNAIVMASQSDWQSYVNKYLAEGDSQAMATVKALFKDVAPEVLNAGIGGFISGAGGGLVGSAMQHGAYNQQMKQQGQQIIEAGGVDAVKALAMEMAGAEGGSKAMSRLAEKVKSDDTGSRNAKRVGRLYDMVGESMDAQIEAEERGTTKGRKKVRGTSTQVSEAVMTEAKQAMSGEQKTIAQVDAKVSADMDSALRFSPFDDSGRQFKAAVKRMYDPASGVSPAEFAKASRQVYEQGLAGETMQASKALDQHQAEMAYAMGQIASGREVQTAKATVQAGQENVSTGDTVMDAAMRVVQEQEEASKLSVEQKRQVVAEAYADLGSMTENSVIINMDQASKDALMKGYDPASGVAPGVYVRGANQAFWYGYEGISMNEDTLPANSMVRGITKAQRDTAYALGVAAAKTAVEKADAAVKVKSVKGKKTGAVHYDGDRSGLTERQRVSLSAMEKIAEALGVQIYVFESKTDSRGRHIGENGWYDPTDGSIHIDLYAGTKGQNTMLFTVAHELTHFIKQWSPAKFKVLADFLMKEYGQKGVSVEALVQNQIAKAKRNGRDISFEVAYEEVIADSMETMLADGNVVEKLAKLKQQDRSLWQKIKDFITDLIAKIRKVYEGLSPDSVEGRYVAEMKDSLEQLQDLFAEAAVEASENYQVSLTPGEEGIVVNENGDPVAHATSDGTIQLSMRTYEEDGREAFRKYLKKCVKSKKLTKAEMDDMLKDIEEIYMTCKEFKDKYAPFSSWSDAAVVRDTYGKPVFSVVTPNGDYKMNLDFSLVCKKRRTLDAVFNEMSKRGIIDDFELGQKSVVKINEIIRKYGLETACALCFVDAKRFRQASMADSFTRLYNELVLSLVPEDQRSSIDHFNFSGYETIKKVEDGIHTWDASKLDFSHLDEVMKNYGEGTVEYKAAKYIKAHAEGRKLLLRGDFMSSRGFDAVKTQNPDVLKLYNSKKGTGGPKAAFGDVQYMNEIIKRASSWTPKKAYAVGGVRIQSFSDYVPRMVFDYVQMVYDLAATKLPAHAYTKEALFVKQFGLTGIKINMSLIPAIVEGGIAPGLDANGNYVWAGESFDYETAKEIQNAEGYTENCGTICVGVSYEHILKLLRDPNIRMVIPYHKSGLNPIVAHMNKIAEFHDYTNDQRTKGKDGKALEKDFDFSKALHEMGKDASPKAVADQYLKWCVANGYTPRFAEFALEDNYYKLLEDFTLYDKDGNFVPQREVRAVFPKEGDAFGSMKSLIESGLQEDAVIEGKRDSRLSSIVDEIQKTLPRSEAEIDETQVAQADRDLEADIKRSDRDLTEDPLYPDTGRERSAFNRMYIDKTNGLKRNEERDIIIVTHLYTYHVRAIGRSYKTKPFLGEILKKVPIDNIVSVDEVREEIINGTYRATEEDHLPYEETPYVRRRNGGRTSSLRERLEAEGYDYLLDEPYEGETEGSRGQGGGDRQSAGIKRSDRDTVPTFYSHMARVVEGVKQEKLGAASVVSMLRGKGVKAEEIKWSGIETFLEGKKSVTKAELQEFIAGSMLQIEEHTSGTATFIADDGNTYKSEIAFKDAAYAVADKHGIDRSRVKFVIDTEYDMDAYAYVGNLNNTILTAEVSEVEGTSPRWGLYKLDGGENYREIVFRMPNSSYSNKMMRVHWGDDAEGILAHARIQDLNTFLGKMLFIEEIQSDWHNEGHKSGYIDESKMLTVDTTEMRHEGEWYNLYHNGRDLHQGVTETFLARRFRNGITEEEIHEGLVEEYNRVAVNSKVGVEDAPFRDNYHEYVLKRLIRMAAEEGYDSIGWTTADIQSDRWSDEFAEGYRIEYDQDIPKFLRKYGKKWGTTVGKTVLDSGTEVWSMAITDSMQESVMTEGQPLYQGRTGGSVSNRSLLADAFEELIQSPKERALIEEYRANISKVEEVQERLKKLRAKIRELTRANGDKAKIAELNETAAELADLIDRYDRKLLELEASKPLKDVLARAKTAAYREARERSEESLKKYRQQVAERFDRGVDSRRKTAMRAKIRKVIRELDKILNRGDKKRNVKEDMKDFVAEALASADVLFTDNYTNEDIIRNGFHTTLTDEEARYAAEAMSILEEMGNLPSGSYEAMLARQEAEEKLKSKLAYRMSKLKDAMERERKLLNEAEVSDVLSRLAESYAKLETSEYSHVNGAYHEAVYQYLKMLQEDVGGTKVRDMTLDQLDELHKAYTMVLTTVRNANTMFAEDLKQSRDQLANRVMFEVHKAGGEHGRWTKGQIARNRDSWNNTKPVYAAERIGSSTFSKLFKGLFKGQYQWGLDMDEAKDFRQRIANKYGFKDWDMEKLYTFESSSGDRFQLSLNQIMSLYAYSKREQAHDHLLKGGFVFGRNTEEVVTEHGIKRHYLNRSATAFNVSDEILGSIISKLTGDQRAFVDEMQDYLSTTMGAKGNEVSMRLYGVKLFLEQFYFPLRSAGQYMEKAKEADMKKQQGQISIANSSFSHATKPKASNPIILDGFTDVWASHVNEMSMYHSMVLPMEDFRRVYNYSSPAMEGQAPVGVNSVIENAYGPEATAYFDQLYKELNGGAITDPRETAFKERIGKFKKAAVMLSTSVVVQQFSAIGRAYALVDPKYFIGARVDKKRHKALWAELKQYAPVAIIKEMGGFDTGMGAGATDYLLKESYGKGEKTKAFFVDEQFRGDVLGRLPALADELTWCSIWEAVKRETKEKNPGMDVRSEEFLQKTGDRFCEVIEKTQVYDSVLARSANMRSKNGLMQMATAFMAEPTTTVNMVEDAIRKGNGKYIARTFGSVAVSILINNALASLVYAMRDDDEDETFLEKYSQALTSGLLDDINPMTYYPVLKDIWSLLQGYDVERSDMSVVADVVDAVKKAITAFSKYDADMDEDELAEHYKNVGDSLLSLLDAGCSALGIPEKNLRREIMAIINTGKTLSEDLFGERDTTWNSFWDAVGGSALDATPVVGLIAGESKQDKLYDAIVSGDTAYVNRLKGGYKDESSYNTAVRKALRENDPRVREAAVADINGDPSERVRIAKEIIAEGHFSQDNVVAAINAEINAISKEESTTSEPKKKGLYTAEDFALEIANGDQAAANAAKVDIIQTAVKNGKTQEEAEKSFASSAKSELKDLFLTGDISEPEAISALATYCGQTEDEAVADVQYWAFKQDYPDVYADDSWFDKYYEEVADSGIEIDMYMSYRNQVKDITGEGKKEKRMAVIHSLPITIAQKDALYYAEGWAASTLYEAPWH